MYLLTLDLSYEILHEGFFAIGKCDNVGGIKLNYLTIEFISKQLSSQKQ